MVCTCRTIPRCPVCNTNVRVPLSNLEAASGAAVIIDRFARRDSTAGREGLQRLAQGYGPCPTCGHVVSQSHSRACVAGQLATLGVSMAEREAILSKIIFPEG
jgi:hypothetical protein